MALEVAENAISEGQELATGDARLAVGRRLLCSRQALASDAIVEAASVWCRQLKGFGLA